MTSIMTSLHSSPFWGLCLALIVVLAAGEVTLGDDDTVLTPQQQARLGERDRLWSRAQELAQAGKLGETVEVLEQVLEIERKVLGEDHEEVVGSLEWLGELHLDLQNYDEARGARRELLEIRTRQHGQENWRVRDATLELADVDLREKLTAKQRQELEEADQLGNVMLDLYSKGKFREALPIAQRISDIPKRTLGEEHPDYAASLNNLAVVYQNMGDYPAALTLHEQARDITKRTLGEEHPAYADSLNNLATVYQAMGDYPAALPLFEQARDIRKRTLGEEHPDYSQSLNNLAMLYRDMGDYPAALPLLEQARDIMKRTLAEQHPSYAASLNNLATLYWAMGDYPAALPLYEQARDIYKRTLG